MQKNIVRKLVAISSTKVFKIYYAIVHQRAPPPPFLIYQSGAIKAPT